jgi:hypothetical protein
MVFHFEIVKPVMHAEIVRQRHLELNCQANEQSNIKNIPQVYSLDNEQSTCHQHCVSKITLYGSAEIDR